MLGAGRRAEVTGVRRVEAPAKTGPPFVVVLLERAVLVAENLVKTAGPVKAMLSRSEVPAAGAARA